MFAVSSGSIGVDLQDIPNEPIRFVADPTNRSRIEDPIIAWTWKTFIENPNNPYVLLRMPMTKVLKAQIDLLFMFEYSFEILGICSCHGCRTTICSTFRCSCSSKISYWWSIESNCHDFLFVVSLIVYYCENFSVDGRVSWDRWYSTGKLFVFNSAWTTAAVDNERVMGAVPIVMDILNLHQVNKIENKTLFFFLKISLF